MVLIHGIPPAFRDGVQFYTANHHWSSAEFCRITQVRTDGVHCRESAGTGLVVLNVVPVTGATCSGVIMDQFLCASLFPHPVVDICDSVQSKAAAVIQS